MSVDYYCERLDPSFWSEPLNALSNISFIFSALVVLRLLKGKQDRTTPLLLTNLFAIGIGSFLFHTYAQHWASIADTVPILLFILTFIYFATRQFLKQSMGETIIIIIAIIPLTSGIIWVTNRLLGSLNGSVAYVSVVFLICVYALILLKINKKTAFGLFYGAAILTISIIFRSIDQTVCHSFPLGTHFMWHVLNSIMLGWMIVVLARHPKN